MMTIGEALDLGMRVFWRAARPGDKIDLDGSNAVLWWQDGREGQPQWADPHILPDLLRENERQRKTLDDIATLCKSSNYRKRMTLPQMCAFCDFILEAIKEAKVET